jgi:hypothetical protein
MKILLIIGVTLLCISGIKLIAGAFELFGVKEISFFLKIWNLFEVILCVFALITLIKHYYNI